MVIGSQSNDDMDGCVQFSTPPSNSRIWRHTGTLSTTSMQRPPSKEWYVSSMCIASGVADSSFQFDSYWILPSSSGLVATSTAQMDPADTHPATSSTAWMHAAVQKRVQAEAELAGPRQELHDYLNSPLVNPQDKTLDVVAWWGVSHVAIALAFADADSSLASETHPQIPNTRPCSSRLPRHSRFSRQV